MNYKTKWLLLPFVSSILASWPWPCYCCNLVLIIENLYEISVKRSIFTLVVDNFQDNLLIIEQIN